MNLLGRYAAPCFIALGLVSSQSSATTTVVIVSDKGIVVATDSRLVSPDKSVESWEAKKVFVVQNRFAIASIGKQRMGFSNPSIIGKDLDYEFGAWVSEIEKSLPDKASFDVLVGVVYDKAGALIPEFQWVIDGAGIQPKNPLEIFDSVIEYVIAGYEDGMPRLSVVKFYINWDAKKVIGPYKVSLEPSGPIAGHTRIYFLGIQQAIANVLNSHSYAYKRAMALSPKAFNDYAFRRPVPLDECTAIAQTLVKIEEETNPKQVGGPVRVVNILPNGRAGDLIDDLPKTRTRRAQ
jgi:hypothetical protein